MIHQPFFCFFMAIFLICPLQLKANDALNDVKIVTSEMSKEIAILKEKAIEQIKTDLQVINLTHQLPFINNIGYIKDMYTRAPKNKQEKALWDLKVIGDVYYDAIHNVVMVRPFGNGEVVVLYVELNNNIYEVTIIE